VDVWIGRLPTRTLAPPNNGSRGFEPPHMTVEKWGRSGEWKKEAVEERGKVDTFPQLSTSVQVGVLRRIGDVIHRLHHPLPEVRI
jgi:hypothetical protein